MRNPLPFADVIPAGDLHRRAALNFQRLHESAFRFDAMIHSSTAKEAPGDWIGRAILGLTLLGQTLKTEPHYLEECIARLPEACNARGYIGVIHPAGTADENQVGGHNGLLRGLCEYHLWKQDPRALTAIRGILRHLMVPTTALYAQYPDQPLQKLQDGSQIGLTVQNEGPWLGLSTDIGTVFFTLDGLTQAYLIEPDPELRKLIETMISRYAQLDVVKLGAQTHSCLTALRGILRWYDTVDARPEYLAMVQARYALYRELAETEIHANFNWFGRPDWTEACAVIDAFMLAVQLWQITGEGDYLTEAHRVYFNAMCYAQRPNGGFGCDHCVGAQGELFISPHRFFEAPWCCSMRGAEGLARAAQYGTYVDPDPGAVWLPFYFEGGSTLRFSSGTLQLACHSEYPHAGKVTYTVIATTLRHPVEFNFFVPPGVKGASMRLTRASSPLILDVQKGFMRVMLHPEPGEVFDLELPLTIWPEQPQNPDRLPGHHRFAHGPLFLGAETKDPLALAADEAFKPMGAGRYLCTRTGTLLAPLDGLTYLSEAQARAHRAQLLFPDKIL
ncbi:MAG: glycoside hydrolase family 127 protein [Cephaloticoccus sp.]|nr:glycoside hydrolase family 127 protein [Cephaloticoccus sp.]